MSEIKPPLKNYLHAFTLYEETQGKRRNTSQTARDAYTEALKSKGYRSWRRNADGVAVRLPQATMIGRFADAALAVAATKAAEVAAEKADPGKFFLGSSIVTQWTNARLDGPRLNPQPGTETKPVASAERNKSQDVMKTLEEFIERSFKR